MKNVGPQFILARNIDNIINQEEIEFVKSTKLRSEPFHRAKIRTYQDNENNLKYPLIHEYLI